MHEPNAEEGTNKPENDTEEAESLGCLPLVAGPATSNALPVEDRTTVHRADGIDEKTEDGEPSSGKDEIGGPVDEATNEREKPEQGQDDGQASDDLGIDVAGMRPSVSMMEAAKVGADDASDDAGEIVLV